MKTKEKLLNEGYKFVELNRDAMNEYYIYEKGEDRKVLTVLCI